MFASRNPFALATLLLLCGCHVAPSVNVLGSFFPAWLISIVTGVVLTVAFRRLFIVTRIDTALRPAALVYASLVFLLTFATWLVVFGG